MFSFVISTLRSRWAAFIGIVIAASTAVALITACGFLLETGLRGSVMPDRLSHVALVGRSRPNHVSHVRLRRGP